MFDPQDDFARVTDGLVAVTVLRPGGPTATAVAHALRHPIRPLAAGGSSPPDAAADAVWHLPVSELPDPPRPGDVILDPEARRWTVLRVRPAGPDGRWRCAARDLVLAYGLVEYVDIEKATYAKSAGGADVASWQVWRTGLPARVQPAEVEVKEEGLNRLAAARFTILLGDDVPLDHAHRIKGPDGTLYAVLGYRKTPPVGVPLEVDAERIG